MVEYFVDLCAVCRQGVLKTDMEYQKGKVFHTLCFANYGKDFVTPDLELAQLSAKTRIELVQLKNMKVRSETQKQSPIPAEKKAGKKPKKKAKAKRSKPKRTKSKARRTKSKAKKPKKKSRRR